MSENNLILSFQSTFERCTQASCFRTSYFRGCGQIGTASHTVDLPWSSQFLDWCGYIPSYFLSLWSISPKMQALPCWTNKLKMSRDTHRLYFMFLAAKIAIVTVWKSPVLDLPQWNVNLHGSRWMKRLWVSCETNNPCLKKCGPFGLPIYRSQLHGADFLDLQSLSLFSFLFFLHSFFSTLTFLLLSSSFFSPVDFMWAPFSMYDNFAVNKRGLINPTINQAVGRHWMFFFLRLDILW